MPDALGKKLRKAQEEQGVSISALFQQALIEHLNQDEGDGAKIRNARRKLRLIKEIIDGKKEEVQEKGTNGVRLGNVRDKGKK